MTPSRRTGILAALLLGACLSQLPAQTLLPSVEETTVTFSHDTVTAYLEQAAAAPHIEVTVEGTSLQGRPIHLVRARHPGTDPTFRILFFGLQHGDEIAGKDALVHLIRRIETKPDLLPRHVDLYVMPSLNPDGGEAGTRTNAAERDLNRDHQWLHEPETQALHRVARRIRPHLAVDAHEYGRDPARYRQRGWMRWPDIMMDTAGHPAFDQTIYQAGLRWVDSATADLAARGHTYSRYYVGGPPPDAELRFSTLELDDARNGLGTYGGLSFIIESGRRSGPNADADLPKRIDAYLVLLERFLTQTEWHESDRQAVEQSRSAPLPAFLPTNSFWGNVGLVETDYPVLDIATGETVRVRTANFMTERIVKSTVPTPQAYAIAPEAAAVLGALLDRHGIAHRVLAEPLERVVESVRLVSIDDAADPLYNRFSGRQMTERGAPASRMLDAGTLLVDLEGPDALRAALLLEPTMLYGIYKHETYRALVASDGTMPVLRVLAK
ncbi:MAG: succinylglutamate desuccinylase/aspartoacylase family protein [Candidatus Sumerlaeia bacterium]|nr:succinylglutamate desuccinylase/aspartoacylase family protein [Candidatus Sumerlaeia bacterium]